MPNNKPIVSKFNQCGQSLTNNTNIKQKYQNQTNDNNIQPIIPKSNQYHQHQATIVQISNQEYQLQANSTKSSQQYKHQTKSTKIKQTAPTTKLYCPNQINSDQTQQIVTTTSREQNKSKQ